MKNSIDNVKKSYGRCLNTEDFIGQFYEVFLKSHPSVPEFFKDVDMANQKKLLRFGINYLILFANGDMAGKSAINRIASTHSKANMAIPPYLYQYWRTSLLKVIEKADYAFTPEIESDWNLVLEKGISYIIAHHDKV
ncbi:hypothetical protein QQ020_28295 [Fulvivirgaceae bacterium BMA12]|uniref:Globin n=1 Tax=Agaribacillus aureus TaxID=3051825 RepID=A0ABT8LE03_9BACT|nr:hypothetical protein [Fulvivirgaceae bacterium BMA12]